MDWWEALWLNEGFAQRMEFVGADHAAPQFAFERSFFGTITASALAADALAGAQQLTNPGIDSSLAVNSQFAAIAYDKGAAVLRGLQLWLAGIGDLVPAAPAAFYGGVSAYLQANAYGTATPADLWAALTAASGIQPLAGWMSGYDSQPGFPLVTVTWATQGASVTGVGVLTISQSRFFASPYSLGVAERADPGFAKKYWVPLTAIVQRKVNSGVTNALAQMRSCSAALETNCAFVGSSYKYTIGTSDSPYSLAADGALKLNAGGFGYYRVNYPVNMWRTLFARATVDASGPDADRVLSVSDVAGLVDDLFAVVEGAFAYNLDNGLGTVFALQQANQLAYEEGSPEVVAPLLDHLLTLLGRLVPDVPLAEAGNPAVSPLADPNATQCVEQYQALAGAGLASIILQNVIEAAYGPFTGAFFPAPDASTDPLLLRTHVAALSAASQLYNEEVVDQAQALYDAGWRLAPVDFQAVVLQSAARWAEPGSGVATALLADYEAETDAGAASRILDALTSFSDRAQLAQLLEWVDASFGAALRVDALPRLLLRLSANPYGRDFAYQYVVDHWDALIESYGSGGFDLDDVVGSLGAGFSGQEYLTALEAFFAAKAADVGSPPTPSVNEVLESVGGNLNWAQYDKASTCFFLNSADYSR